MKRTLAVAEYIFKQSFRNKILNVLIIFAVFAIGFSYFISELAQEVELKMVKDFGLFAIEIFAFMTLMLSMTVQLYEETELKTINLVLVKPVKRFEYMIGKYLGIAATVLMNVLIMLLILMAIIKFRGGDAWDLRLILSAFYSFLGITILTSTALLLSALTTSVPTCIIYLFFIYILGHLTVHLKNIAAQLGNAVISVIVDVVYYVIPNLELFNLKDKIYSSEGLFSLPYFGVVMGYAVIYSVLTLIITTVIFNKREF